MASGTGVLLQLENPDPWVLVDVHYQSTMGLLARRESPILSSYYKKLATLNKFFCQCSPNSSNNKSWRKQAAEQTTPEYKTEPNNKGGFFRIMIGKWEESLLEHAALIESIFLRKNNLCQELASFEYAYFSWWDGAERSSYE